MIRELFKREKGNALITWSSREDGNMRASAGEEGRKNREEFRKRYLLGATFVMAGVVHRTEVAVVEKDSPEIIMGVDALITRERGIFILTTKADCIPCSIYDPVGGILAVAHLSAKTLTADILLHVVKMMNDMGSRPDNLLFVSGPGICKNCYEYDPVDAEEVFRGNYRKFVTKKGGVTDKVFPDLRGIMGYQLAFLLEAKKGDDRISISGECTCCNPDKYFSARAEKMKPPHIKAGVFGAMKL